MTIANPSQQINPAFENPLEIFPGWSGPITFPLNPREWATAACAVQLATRYGAKPIALRPYFPQTWGTGFSPGSMWFLLFPDNVLHNAGVLADVWRRDPQNADNECIAFIDAARAGDPKFAG